MFEEDELLPISALQHLLFCERQCALIHLEGLWSENRLTAEGKNLHSKVHSERASEWSGGIRIARGLLLRSLRLGLVGKADVVEFHPSQPPVQGESTVSPYFEKPAPQVLGRPYPVEYKRGRPKAQDCDRVQLCAQALCLEEMLGVDVPRGALFYGKRRRRTEVEFTRDLRETTERAASRLREIVDTGKTPQVPKEAKCQRCSLIDLCLPGVTSTGRSASRYLTRCVENAGQDHDLLGFDGGVA